jgi:hypothetical protein
MASDISWIVLVAAFLAVAACSALLAVRLHAASRAGPGSAPVSDGNRRPRPGSAP